MCQNNDEEPNYRTLRHGEDGCLQVAWLPLKGPISHAGRSVCVKPRLKPAARSWACHGTCSHRPLSLRQSLLLLSTWTQVPPASWPLPTQAAGHSAAGYRHRCPGGSISLAAPRTLPRSTHATETDNAPETDSGTTGPALGPACSPGPP